MNKLNLFFGLILLFTLACNDTGDHGNKNKIHFRTDTSLNPEIAKGFRIKEHGNIKLIEIVNPWDSGGVVQKFYLVPDPAPDLVFDDGQLIEVPIKQLVCLSASHLSFLDALGKIDLLNGVSNADYVVSKEFQGLVNSGKIREIGIGEHFMLEELIDLNPDIVMVSPQKGQAFTPLQNAGLTVVPNGDYLEAHPLGRAEWIKFMGVLSGKEREAKLIFDSIKNEYNRLKRLTENISDRPTVISGRQYGGFWNLPGGNSYEARFLQDAGAGYLWAENENTGGIMLDFETVYDRGLNADYWRFIVFSPHKFTYKMLLDEDARYADFAAVKNKKVIICNTLDKPFFQKGFLEPQVILADYISIFHPGLMPDHSNVYYELME